MRRTMFLASLASALALGVLLSGSALASSGGSDRPFRITVSGTGSLNLVTGAAQNVYSGQATHLGLTKAEESAQLVPTGPGAFEVSSSLTARAANGDQLFLTSMGTGTTTDGVHFTFTVHDMVSGGTGRFTNATGFYHATVQVTIVSVDGVIATSEIKGAGVGQLSY